MSQIAALRSTLLNAAFRALYGPLAALHEPIGRALFGAAWDSRRRALLDTMPSTGLLDVGCGEGRLLARARQLGINGIGVEPSRMMARRARVLGVWVVLATADALPFRDASFDGLVCSYPGNWIADDASWREFARTLATNAPVAVLLGGDYNRGRLRSLRSLALRLAYGGSTGVDLDALPVLGNVAIAGGYVKQFDEWGSAVYWIGTRR